VDSQTIDNRASVGVQVNIDSVGTVQLPPQLPTPFLAPPPPPDPSLVGRTDLLNRLKDLLASHESAGLDGLPGSGKTAIAVDLANDRDLFPSVFPDGVLWAGLGRHPIQLERLAAWGRSLALPAPGQPKPSTLKEWEELLHAVIGDRRMLLVVDDAWESTIALAFRLGGPNCGHLLTTRKFEVAEAFAGPSGEFGVRELTDEQAIELISRLAPDAVQEQRGATQELIHQVGGLPLALNLLGRYLESQARVGMATEALQELRDAQRRLEVQVDQAALGHHPDFDPEVPLSLVAIIGVSDDALNDEEKRTLRSLARFPAKPSTFSKEAAMAVADTSATTVASLVRAGLVEYVGHRFTLHQTIADYARVQSSDPEPLRRMADFYTAFVEEHEREYLGGGNAPAWLEMLEAEQDNMRAVLRWSKESGEAEAGLRLAGALWRFWEVRGFYKEGSAILEELLALPGASLHTRARAKALNGAGDLAYRFGDYSAARRLHEDGLAIEREFRDEVAIADSVNDLANITNALSDYPAAIRLYEESLQLHRRLGNVRGEAVALNNLGYVAQRQGDYRKARNLLEKSLKAFRELGNVLESGFSLTGLGLIAVFEGRYDAAQAAFEEGLRIRSQLEDRRGMAESTGGLGLVAMRTGELDRAAGLFEESLRLRKELDDRPGTAFSLTDLSLLRGYQDYPSDARSYAEEAYEIRRGLGDRRGMGDSIWALGFAGLQLRDLSAARSRFEESLAVREEIGDRRGICESLEGLAAVDRREGAVDSANDRIRNAASLRKTIGAPVAPIDSTWLQAEPGPGSR
jgi:tetratricopeptide (TPR) repeat protein